MGTFRRLGSAAAYCFIVILAVLAPASTKQAYGDVGVVLNGALDSGIARITASGHSAVYLSRICPASPIKMRLCGPGENGSIISNYENFQEDQKFEWNIVPVNVFVYGVRDLRDRPLYGSEQIKRLLEDEYRREYLTEYCGETPCIEDKNANWRDMVAEDFARNIYVFAAKTTLQQDEELIARFNSMPNHDHFNAFASNCADFTRELIDSYFPGAAHRDYINDFGMTSPKSVAHDFAHYAAKHPQMEYRVIHFPQLPGTIKRSAEARDGTEQLYHSKKLLTPMLYLAPHEAPLFAASYLIWGRFNPQHEFEKHPSSERIERNYEEAGYGTSDRTSELAYVALHRTAAERDEENEAILGDAQQWSEYRQQFDQMLDEAIRQRIVANRDAVRGLFKHLEKTGVPMADSHGFAWMQLHGEEGTSTRVGLTANTLLAEGSDPRVAYEIMLARVDRELNGHEKDRETMREFGGDWQLLVRARARVVRIEQIQTASERASFR